MESKAAKRKRNRNKKGSAKLPKDEPIVEVLKPQQSTEEVKWEQVDLNTPNDV